MRGTQTEGEVFIARYSRVRLLALSILGLLMTAASLLLTGALGSALFAKEPGPLVIAFGVFAAIFFGGTTLRFLRPLIFGGKAIRIDEVGLTDYRISPEPISWDNIRTLYIYRNVQRLFGVFPISVGSQICYTIADDHELSLSLWSRWLKGLNSFLGFDHHLHHSATDKGIEDIAAAINDFAPRRLHLR